MRSYRWEATAGRRRINFGWEWTTTCWWSISDAKTPSDHSSVYTLIWLERSVVKIISFRSRIIHYFSLHPFSPSTIKQCLLLQIVYLKQIINQIKNTFVTYQTQFFIYLVVSLRLYSQQTNLTHCNRCLSVCHRPVLVIQSLNISLSLFKKKLLTQSLAC